jgi:hypothetical protein
MVIAINAGDLFTALPHMQDIPVERVKRTRAPSTTSTCRDRAPASLYSPKPVKYR